jgi:hypothetical protein
VSEGDGGRARGWLLAGALASVLLLGNVAARVRPLTLDSDDQGWRGWDDLAVACGQAERGEFPVAAYALGNRTRRRSEEFAEFRRLLVEGVAQAGLGPARFWRTLPEGTLAPIRDWRIARRFDDVGRSVLLGMGFHLLGGIAPYLILWLAPLGLVPVLFWTAYELGAARRLLGGAVFLCAVATSAFVVDALTLRYSAVGFYLLSLLMLVPLAVYAALGTPTRRGLIVRLLGLTVPLGVCILARNGTLLAMPGYALAVGIAAWRIAPRTPLRRTALVAVAAALLGTGVLLLAWPVLNAAMHRTANETIQRHGQRRPLRHGHDVWSTIWQGLGDFDRTHGHVFMDAVTEEKARAEGAPDWLSAEGEAVLRRLTLGSIASDPLWYAGILARRLAATVTLHKLWPWPPTSGRSMTPASSENEGVLDSYYGLASHADVVRLGALTVELPMALYLLPTAALVVFALRPGPGRWASLPDEARPALLPLACLAGAALPTPVIITTGTALEVETFVLVHHLALGLLVAAVRRSASMRSTIRP